MGKKIPVFDTDYGNYSDFGSSADWTDGFRLTKESKEYITKLWREFMDEAAYECGLDTSEWTPQDWWDFEDRISECR